MDTDKDPTSREVELICELVYTALYGSKADSALDAYTRRAMLYQAAANVLLTVATNMTTMRTCEQEDRLGVVEAACIKLEGELAALTGENRVVCERRFARVRAKRDAVMAQINAECQARICDAWKAASDAFLNAERAWEDAHIEQYARKVQVEHANDPIGVVE